MEKAEKRTQPGWLWVGLAIALVLVIVVMVMGALVPTEEERLSDAACRLAGTC